MEKISLKQEFLWLFKQVFAFTLKAYDFPQEMHPAERKSAHQLGRNSTPDFIKALNSLLNSFQF